MTARIDSDPFASERDRSTCISDSITIGALARMWDECHIKGFAPDRLLMSWETWEWVQLLAYPQRASVFISESSEPMAYYRGARITIVDDYPTGIIDAVVWRQPWMVRLEFSAETKDNA